jgi:MFS family permease
MTSLPASFADTTRTRLATRLSFFAAGFLMACFAPLVPFAKANVGIGEGKLGLIFFCLGVGSIIAMPLTGWISAQIGSKPMILTGGLGLVLVLPVLLLIFDPLVLAAVLLLFGASLGTIDVAMNVHAVEIEKSGRRPLMSGFHAMFSLGGFAGSGTITFLLSRDVSPFASAICASALALVAILLAWPRLLQIQGRKPFAFASKRGMALILPRGIVLLLAVLAGITFLVEGAILDWSALLLLDRNLVDTTQGGLGYMLFSIAMTVGRLTGDQVVAGLGARRVLFWGGLLTVGGFVLLLTVRWVPALLGFVLIGLGASNIVPVLLSLAGRQTVMPAGLAVAAVTSTGYAGVLVGPAAVGFVAHVLNLPTAFWLLTALITIVPIFARTATRSGTDCLECAGSS